MEATGGLERALAAQLSAAGIALRIINARHVRHFAKATGLLAKTDRLDAEALVRFAQMLKPEPRPIAPEQTVALQALIVRRRQLVEMLTMERNRLRTAHRGVRKSLQSSIRWLEKRLAEVDGDIDGALRECGAWREKVELLESVPGIARVISVSLLAGLPELGSSTGTRSAHWPAWRRSTATAGTGGAGAASTAGGRWCAAPCTWRRWSVLDTTRC